MMNFVFYKRELCIKNEELCINNEDFVLKMMNRQAAAVGTGARARAAHDGVVDTEAWLHEGGGEGADRRGAHPRGECTEQDVM